MWERAKDAYDDLVAELGKATEEALAAKGEYDPLKLTADEMTQAKQAHATESKDYLDAFNAINDRVTELVNATGGSSEVTAKTNALGLIVQNTTDAGTAVANQRARVEALVTAKSTQDQEVASWGERVSVANTAKLTADDVEDAADAELATTMEQVSKRSWLFTVLGQIDATNWAADCQDGSRAKCAYTESARTASTSTWAWNDNDRCDYTSGAGQTLVTHTCQMLGLKGADAGLIQSATAALGLSRAANSGTATGLWAAYDTADYTYAAAGDSAETDALNQYETWMKKVLLAEAKRSTCWKLTGTGAGAAHAAGDVYSWCVAFNGVNQSGATG
jgi:hypothetical protein